MNLSRKVQKYVASKNWKWRPNTDQVNIEIKVCPFCGSPKWKFSMHGETGIFKCFVCEAKGNLYTLKQMLGDMGETKDVQSAAKATGTAEQKNFKPLDMANVEKWHAKLLQKESAVEYLAGRGINVSAIMHFKLGYRKKDGVDWLVIPHIANGKCWNIKMRTLPPHEKDFRRQAGCKSILFNSDCLADHNTIVCGEAELDAISWWCAGVKNVVALTAGASTFLPEWYDQLADKEMIYTALDTDVPGQKGAREIARRMGFDRTANVFLPRHDANDVLRELGPDALAATLETAEQFEVSGVLKVQDVLYQCIHNQALGGSGFHTPWASVNRLIGKEGFLPGDLIILSATPKTGKTTLALNLALFLAQQGVPSLFFCLEMKPTRIGRKIVSMMREKNTDDLEPLDFKLVQHSLRALPFMMVDPAWDSKITVDSVIEKIREVVKRYGIRFLVFDHLHFLCRSIKYITTEVGAVTKKFKLLAEELDIVIVLIAQPGKVRGERVMTMQDLKHSSDIAADGDWIILAHRSRVPAGSIAETSLDDAQDQEVLDPKTLLRIEAARFGGGGEAHLHYEGALAKFYDMRDKPVRTL